jgi:hypothetical protein
VRIWRYACPAFAPESLERVGVTPLKFDGVLSEHAGGVNSDVRTRALIDVLSPDSTRSLDFDMYLDFDRDPDGRILIEREPDSAPVLADFKRDTLWRVNFCGTSCAYDGAYWVDAQRFGLTGAQQSGPQYDGPWQGFLEVYDLGTRKVKSWTARPVSDSQFDQYRRAWESSLVARLEQAGLRGGADSSTGSRLGLGEHERP